DIAIIGWNISPMVRNTDKTEAQLLLEVVSGAVDDTGITRAEVDFTCAGSCDYVAGQAFSFVQNIDSIGAWPPKRDSHVAMDGAWAACAGGGPACHAGTAPARSRWFPVAPRPPIPRTSIRWRWTPSISRPSVPTR